MRIKICIANYGKHQLWCLEHMLAEFASYKKYEVDITEYTTEKSDRKHILFDESIRKALPFSCRYDIAKSINDYDLFLYTENDMLITEDNMDAWIECNNNLDLPYVPGFYRYEIRNNEKILIDLNPFYGRIYNEIRPSYFSVNNNHQACYLLDKKQLKFCIDSKQFLVPPHDGPYGMLEQGATDPYNRCGLQKIFPLNKVLLKRLGIQHLPLKYSTWPQWKNAPTIDQLSP